MNFSAFSLSFVLALALNTVFVTSTPNAFGSTIKFYKGPTLNDFVSYDLATAHNVADDTDFHDSSTTVIFFHGYQQSPTSDASQLLLNAFLGNGTFNVLALDWSEAASYIFIEFVVAIMTDLGEAVALFIDKLNLQKGVPFSKMNLIGHSLGAHLAGIAGKFTVDWSGSTKYIGRITGLDPAVIAPPGRYLHWSNANFVDIIHTDSNGFGSSLNNGHVDHWPNNGVAPQPGCTPGKCSHFRAVHFYAESVVRAYRAGNFLSINNANANIVIEMGLNGPTSNAQGQYTLYTNAASWYSKS